MQDHHLSTVATYPFRSHDPTYGSMPAHRRQMRSPSGFQFGEFPQAPVKTYGKGRRCAVCDYTILSRYNPTSRCAACSGGTWCEEPRPELRLMPAYKTNAEVLVDLELVKAA